MSDLRPPGPPPPPGSGRPDDDVPDALPPDLQALAALLAHFGDELDEPLDDVPPLPPGLEAAVVARVRAEREGATRVGGTGPEVGRPAAGHAAPDGEVVTGLADRRAGRARRWGVGPALGALAVAAAVVVGVIVVAGGGGEDEGDTFAFTEAPPGAQASFTLRARPWGTEIELDVDGLDPGATYWLWLTDESGERTSAGTFAGPSGEASLTFTSVLPAHAARRVWVTDAADDVVLDALVPA